MRVFLREQEFYLRFVALLCTQSRSWRVKLLGYDTQELRLVLCAVAVRRADVHHLAKRETRDAGRCAEERGTETERVSVREDFWSTAEKNRDSGRS